MKFVPAWGLFGASVCVCATLLAVAAPASADQPSTGSYTVVVSLTAPPPASVAGGAVSKFTVTLTNTSRNQTKLNSANINAPAGFMLQTAALPAGSSGSATVTGNGIGLRDLNLDPGASVGVSVSAATPCAAGSYAWSSTAMSKADSDGDGDFDDDDGTPLKLQRDASALTTQVSSPCSLQFTTQPADTVIDQTITGSPFDASGPVLTVVILDGNGALLQSSNAPVTIALNPGTGNATLGGTTTETASNGVATFGDLTVDQPGERYTLSASSPGNSAATLGISPATSTTFSAVNAGTPCLQGQRCKATASTPVSSLTVDAAGVGGATVSVSIDVGAQLQCAGYTAEDPNWFSFLSSATSVGKQITYRYAPSDPSAPGQNSAAASQLCFGAPYPFTTSSGVTATPGTLPDGTAGYIGLLPRCSNGNGPPPNGNGPPPDANGPSGNGNGPSGNGNGPPQGSGPCISRTRQEPNSSNIDIDVSIPAGLAADPWGRV